MNVNEPILLGKEEQLKVKAGNQTVPVDEFNTTTPTATPPTSGTFMVKDSSIT
jgi:hypothetical protein